MRTKEERWANDLERYKNLLKLSDLSQSIRVIEFLQERMAGIENDWPSQSKIFEQMKRE